VVATFDDGKVDEVEWSGASLGAKVYLWYARKVPPHPAKLRLTGFVGKHFFSQGLSLTNQVGTRIRIDLTQPDFIPHALVYSGAWEPRSLALAMELMKTGGVFVDVGSHFGLYSCTVGKLDGVSCICIEPSPPAFLALQKNLSLNPQVKARLIHAGVSSKTMIRSFGQTSPQNSGTARVLASDNGYSETCLIACMTLDDVLGSVKPQPPIRLLKIDVEGHELEVFKGLDWSGPFRPENIISEFNPSLLQTRTGDGNAFLKFFDENDYDVLTILGAPFRTSLPPPEENLWLRSRTTSAVG
jgi:FkbM family methyltransferase